MKSWKFLCLLGFSLSVNLLLSRLIGKIGQQQQKDLWKSRESFFFRPPWTLWPNKEFCWIDCIWQCEQLRYFSTQLCSQIKGLCLMLSYHFLNPTLSAQLCLRTLVCTIYSTVAWFASESPWVACNGYNTIFPITIAKSQNCIIWGQVSWQVMIKLSMSLHYFCAIMSWWWLLITADYTSLGS